VLAYTTGDLRPWRSVWNRNQQADDMLENIDESQNDERPAGWTIAQEAALQTEQKVDGALNPPQKDISSSDSDLFRRPILLDATLLKCALLAVALRVIHYVKKLMQRWQN